MKEKPFVLCDESWSGRAAGYLGKGLVAGILGTIVITISQQIEMEKTGRQPSNSPLLAAQKVFQTALFYFYQKDCLLLVPLQYRFLIRRNYEFLIRLK